MKATSNQINFTSCFDETIVFISMIYTFSAKMYKTMRNTRQKRKYQYNNSNNIAFLVHISHIDIQINHSKIQLNKLFSLLIQFNKIAIQYNISEASLQVHVTNDREIEKQKITI